jgi:hypothetical protein
MRFRLCRRHACRYKERRHCLCPDERRSLTGSFQRSRRAVFSKESLTISRSAMARLCSRRTLLSTSAQTPRWWLKEHFQVPRAIANESGSLRSRSVIPVSLSRHFLYNSLQTQNCSSSIKSFASRRKIRLTTNSIRILVCFIRGCRFRIDVYWRVRSKSRFPK